MTEQDFIERPCVGWDEENKKCKFGHNPNGALLCRGNIAFNNYEEGETACVQSSSSRLYK